MARKMKYIAPGAIHAFADFIDCPISKVKFDYIRALKGPREITFDEDHGHPAL
jgi:hypothetical protein